MAKTNIDMTSTADREIVATRIFDAPRELVFDAWTDPGHIAQWWGPNGFTSTIHEMDVRPGGVWRFIMHGPDGTDYNNKSVYEEVVRPERIAYSHVSGPKFRVTVTFDEEGDKTRLTMRMIFDTAEERDRAAVEYGAVEGLSQTLGRLGAHLAQMGRAEGEFVTTREFDAPRDLVFKVWTEPRHLMQWWGPKGFTMLSCTLDLRPGGVFHYGMRSPNGQEIWGKWIFREVAAPERLVFVASFSDAACGVTRHPMAPDWPLETLSTLTLTEHDGKTTLTMRGIPINATEAERQTFEAGRDSMRMGWAGTLDKLAQYLAGVS